MEQLSNTVYSINATIDVNQNAGTAYTFNLNNFHRKFKLKSVAFDYIILAYPDMVPYPLALNNIVYVGLLIGSPAITPQLARIFEDLAPIVPVNNGNSIKKFQPGQWLFNNFFINDTCPFFIDAFNHDLVIKYALNVTVIAEIEELQVTI